MEVNMSPGRVTVWMSGEEIQKLINRLEDFLKSDDAIGVALRADLGSEVTIEFFKDTERVNAA